jgi:hypothetical protein
MPTSSIIAHPVPLLLQACLDCVQIGIRAEAFVGVVSLPSALRIDTASISPLEGAV